MCSSVHDLFVRNMSVTVDNFQVLEACTYYLYVKSLLRECGCLITEYDLYVFTLEGSFWESVIVHEFWHVLCHAKKLLGMRICLVVSLCKFVRVLSSFNTMDSLKIHVTIAINFQ